MGRMFALPEVPDAHDFDDPRESPDLSRYATREPRASDRAG